MKLFDATLGHLEQALDLRLLRQNTLAGNIANADTPGFVPQDVDFSQAMRQAQMQPLAPSESFVPAVNPGFLPLVSAAAPPLAPLLPAPDSTPGLDGNRVDLDRTMASLAENALQYGAAARAAGKKLAILRYVASDGNA